MCTKLISSEMLQMLHVLFHVQTSVPRLISPQSHLPKMSKTVLAMVLHKALFSVRSLTLMNRV